jgi:hypothetical protein
MFTPNLSLPILNPVLSAPCLFQAQSFEPCQKQIADNPTGKYGFLWDSSTCSAVNQAAKRFNPQAQVIKFTEEAPELASTLLRDKACGQIRNSAAMISFSNTRRRSGGLTGHVASNTIPAILYLNPETGEITSQPPSSDIIPILIPVTLEAGKNRLTVSSQMRQQLEYMCQALKKDPKAIQVLAALEALLEVVDKPLYDDLVLPLDREQQLLGASMGPGIDVLPSPQEQIISHNLAALQATVPTGQTTGGLRSTVGLLGVTLLRRCEFYLDVEGRITGAVRSFDYGPRGTTYVHGSATGIAVYATITHLHEDGGKAVILDYETSGQLTQQQQANFGATFHAQNELRGAFFEEYPLAIDVADKKPEGQLAKDLFSQLRLTMMEVLVTREWTGPKTNSYLLVQQSGQMRIVRISNIRSYRDYIVELSQYHTKPQVLGGFQLSITQQNPMKRDKGTDRDPPLQVTLTIPENFSNRDKVIALVQLLQKSIFNLNRIIVRRGQDMAGYSDKAIIETVKESLVPDEFINENGELDPPSPKELVNGGTLNLASLK